MIQFIREAGIKLWVLTGDKVETAINIGFSCDLLDEEMEIFVLKETNTKALYREICDAICKQKQIGLSRDSAVVVGGDQLLKITAKGKEKLLDEFIALSQNASVVLACRVSPKQKAEVVNIIRERKAKEGVTTLAIGDGANDVNMITAAHIGIGISGLEG